jgi:glycosyltransferase involved in cell wall biosynthesis
MDASLPCHFAVVIPAYNEAPSIADIALRARRFTDLVIVVDDGSRDGTAQALMQLPVTVLHNPANIGKGKSICRGAQYALARGASAIVTLDGDGQHRPEDIPQLLDRAARQPGDLIIAARLRERRQAPVLRRFANRCADFWISWAAGQRICDSQSGFRLYPAAVFRQCTTESNGFVFESEILIDAARRGINTGAIAIDTLYDRNSRASHYRPVTDTCSIVRMVAWKLIQRGLYPLGLLRSLGILPASQVSRQ